MLKYIIVCPMVFLAGMIDAIAGGGGLLTLPAYIIAGLPAHNAIATNKLSSSFGAVVSFSRYAKMGYVPWKLVPFCIISSIISSIIGSNISLLIDDTILKIVLLLLLPLTAFFAFRIKFRDCEQETEISRKTYVLCVIISFVMGMYDGFYGPGTGTFILLLLTSVAHLSLQRSNGLAKAVNLASNVSALAVFLINGKAYITLGLVAGVFSMGGSYLGTKMFSEKGGKIVRPVLIFVLAVFFVKIIYEMFV